MLTVAQSMIWKSIYKNATYESIGACLNTPPKSYGFTSNMNSRFFNQSSAAKWV